MRRRRFGTLVFFVLLLCGIVMPFVLPMSHWWTLVAAVTFVGWLGLCRFSVWSLERQLGGELADWACAENTVQIAVPDDDASERSIEITEEIKNTLGSLWDPIPVTPTTYVSRPLLPRSVRTIDLSAPVSSSELQMPVSVERAEFDEAEEDRPTAIGE